MSTPRKTAMKRAHAKLKKALVAAESACAELQIEAHRAIDDNNIPPPWAVRSVAMNVRKTIELAQCLALDLAPTIHAIKS